MWCRFYGPIDWAAFSLLCLFVAAVLAQITRIWRPGLGRGLAAIVLPLLACVTLAVWPWSPVVREHIVPVDGLRRPVTIAHLSDAHLTCRMPAAWRNRQCAERAVARVREIDPDLVLLTGDYVDRSPDFAAVAEVFASLAAMWPTYAVLGNHDYWEVECPDQAELSPGRPDDETDWARLLNARLLRNEAQRIPLLGITIVGVDDPVTSRDDITRALRGVRRSDVKLMIAHSPDLFRKAARERVDVLLAGHTHGGQVWLPALGPLYTRSLLRRPLRQQLATGCRCVSLPGGKRMYVVTSSGLGVTCGAPFRLGCPPEVTKVVLVPAGSPEARQTRCERLEFPTALDPWLDAE